MLDHEHVENRTFLVQWDQPVGKDILDKATDIIQAKTSRQILLQTFPRLHGIQATSAYITLSLCLFLPTLHIPRVNCQTAQSGIIWTPLELPNVLIEHEVSSLQD